MPRQAGRQPVRDAGGGGERGRLGEGGCGGRTRGSWRDPKWRTRGWRARRPTGPGGGGGTTRRVEEGWAEGSLADYVAGWPGERNPGEDAATPRRSVGRSVGGAEEAGLPDRGEYIRNVLPTPTLRALSPRSISLGSVAVASPLASSTLTSSYTSYRHLLPPPPLTAPLPPLHPPPHPPRPPSVRPSRSLAFLRDLAPECSVLSPPLSLCLSALSLSPSRALAVRAYLSSSLLRHRGSFQGGKALS